MLAICNDLAIPVFLILKEKYDLLCIFSFCWGVMHSASMNALQRQEAATPFSLNHFY